MAGRWLLRGTVALAVSALGSLGLAAWAAPPAPTGDGQIAVTVARDTVFDGVYHSSDQGVPGVRVTAVDAAGQVLSGATDAAGGVAFTVPAGAYRVEATAPAGLWPARIGTGSAAFDPLVSFVTVAAGGTSTATMGVADPADWTRLHPSAVEPVQIGDRVWRDSDGDGVQEPGEPPLAGVRCVLSDDSGPVGAPVITDAAGYYRFDAAPDSTYTIACDGAPAGLVPTVKGVGADPAIDSNGGTDRTMSVTTGGPGRNDQGFDLGYAPVTVGVGDRVWFDANGDGRQDAGDTSIGGVAVTVTDGDARAAGSAITAADGSYEVTGLTAATPYTICFDPGAATGLPAGVTAGALTPTARAAGADPTVDSDIDATECASFTSPDAGTNDTVDAGFAAAATPTGLGDRVFLDTDGDGRQTAVDLPIEGVAVRIATVSGALLGTDVTDAAGRYGFTGLAPSTPYRVCFDPSGATGLPAGVAPAALAPTRANRGGDARDSDIDATGCATVTTPATGTDRKVDAGYTSPPSGLGDRAWFDANGDGVQDGGDTPLAGVAVTATDPRGVPAGGATTGADGEYEIDGLASRTAYRLCFDASRAIGLPAGVTADRLDPTARDAGRDDAADSDVDATGCATATTPPTGVDPKVDAGYTIVRR